MIRRIIVKIKGKTPDKIKLSIKCIGGYWDDLFDGWSLPLESANDLKLLVNGLDSSIREFALPIDHINQKPKERNLYSKYGMLTQKLLRDERKLMIEITAYERDYKRKDDLAWNWSEYEEMPKSENQLHSDFLIQRSFHYRYLELRALRTEISLINNELKAFEA